MNYTFPLVTNCLNIVIVIVLARSLYTLWHYHNVIKNICALLLIANTFAMIVGLLRLFIYGYNGVPDVLLFGNFADRYTMFFAYLYLKDLKWIG